MGVKEHKKHTLGPANCAVITVSTTRTEDTDESGKAINDLLKSGGHNVVHYNVVKDDISQIKEELEDLVESENVHAIILNGGTGISQKDVTIEAVRSFINKELTGFGELFRYLSYKDIGSPALLSRAMAGVANGKILICLPGSTDACKLAVKKLILPELGHMIHEIGK